MDNRIIIAAVFASTTLVAGCAGEAPKVAQVSATGESEGGYMHVFNGKRQEYLVGSRLPRETRENAESVKALGSRAWKEVQEEKSGAPMDSQKTGF
jgi:hypothetical protein